MLWFSEDDSKYVDAFSLELKKKKWTKVKTLEISQEVLCVEKNFRL